MARRVCDAMPEAAYEKAALGARLRSGLRSQTQMPVIARARRRRGYVGVEGQAA